MVPFVGNAKFGLDTHLGRQTVFCGGHQHERHVDVVDTHVKKVVDVFFLVVRQVEGCALLTVHHAAAYGQGLADLVLQFGTKHHSAFVF